jgi:hypothetical protein
MWRITAAKLKSISGTKASGRLPIRFEQALGAGAQVHEVPAFSRSRLVKSCKLQPRCRRFRANRKDLDTFSPCAMRSYGPRTPVLPGPSSNRGYTDLLDVLDEIRGPMARGRMPYRHTGGVFHHKRASGRAAAPQIYLPAHPRVEYSRYD